MPKKMQMPVYDRVGKASIETVIRQVLDNMESPTKSNHRVLVDGEMVKITSLRLRTFATKGVVCAECGISGSFFAVERGPKNTGPYHLNLWAVNEDGEEILMTHDHILARSLNGKDDLSNCQTMCGPCNWKKGQQEGVKFLRMNSKRKERVVQEYISP